MDYLCDDLIYILFGVYQKAPHILLTNKYVDDMFNVNINECYYVTKKNTFKKQYYKNYNIIFECINGYFYCKQFNNTKLSLAGVSRSEKALKYVPEHLKTPELCLASTYNRDIFENI